MIKKNIPNTLTLGNLFCGCLALVQAFNGNLVWAAYFVGISLVLDFFDGFAARALKVSSPIGKDLDSLADMVTFGVVPGVVMFKMLSFTLAPLYLTDIFTGTEAKTDSLIPYLGFIITVFSCIRLAKFNNDTRQSDSFIGLPTPANTMVICSFPLIAQAQIESQGLNLLEYKDLLPVLSWFLVGITVVFSILLVAEIPLFALKFKNFSWLTNKLVYSFLAVTAVLVALLKFVAIPLVIVLYILVSIVNNIFLKNKV
ncbi:CDP-diacylglycerol--serine O-phosphatidyltransferase [Sphingobacteriaceae bacterium]|nr:CDP-diacylglycerol--serine O-phosphatidyltransferase [Sphingobacteriaceae bacterium]